VIEKSGISEMRRIEKLRASAVAAAVVVWLWMRLWDDSGSGIGRIVAIFDTSFRLLPHIRTDFEMRFKLATADDACSMRYYREH